MEQIHTRIHTKVIDEPLFVKQASFDRYLNAVELSMLVLSQNGDTKVIVGLKMARAIYFQNR